MPANRFGAVNTQPIYNVTGRNPRDMEQGPTAQPFQAPAAGVAKDFSADQRQQPQRGFMGQLLGDAYWNPMNPLNALTRGGGRGGGRRGGGGGGGGDGGDGGEGGGTQPITINFGDQSGHRAYENAGAVQGITIQGNNEGNITGGNPFSTSTQTLADGGAPAPGASTAKAPRTRKPLTDEQRAKRNQQAQARRAAKKQSGETPKPRTPRAKKTPAATPGGTPSVTNNPSTNIGPVTQSGDIKNTQRVNFP